jgi:peptidoglycan/LPS O-acetylase OafA/YrhL
VVFGSALKTLWLRDLFKWISEISYSLYLFHFPFLFFICAGMLGGSQWHPGLNAYLIFTGLALLTLVIGILAWLLFERHTPAARRLIERILNRGIAAKQTGP